MERAVDQSLRCDHLRGQRFAGARALARLQARVLDDMGSMGVEEQVKVANNGIPTMLKIFNDLVLTPGAVAKGKPAQPGSVEGRKPAGTVSQLAEYQRKAQSR